MSARKPAGNHHEENTVRHRKRKKIRPKWVLYIIVLVLVFGFAGVVVAGEVMIDEEKLIQMSQTTTFYDATGAQEIASRFVENRQLVQLSEVPDIVQKAFIATEDRRFMIHFGVDPIGMTRAMVNNIRAGKVVEGGSTITQQLAENALHTIGDRSFAWKVREMIIAVNLERKYSKEEILEMYLNRIYFGHGAYGIQTASELYFGKPVSDLTLGEAALLAGLPKAPNNYSPYNDMQAAIERRSLILELMEEQGYITAEEREMAESEEVKLVGLPKKKAFAQAYIHYVFREAEERYGFTEDELLRGGYQVYTNLNMQAQEAIEEVYGNKENFPVSAKGDHLPDTGMVIVDHHTGGIVAMAGGLDYEPVVKENWAIAAGQQPGSSIKPVTVYGPALENGWEPYDVLHDERMTYEAYGGFTPKNDDGRYRGQVTMYEALTNSINAAAVWLLNEIGVETGYQFANRLGMDLAEEDAHNLAIALGGLTEYVSPLKMAQAYTAFANYGTVMHPYAIQKITTADSRLVVQAEPYGEEVMSTQNAYYLTRMLENAVNNGTGTAAQMDRAVAGKTGTVALDEDHYDFKGNAAAWFVGYTPEWTAAVWMGFNRIDEEHYLSGSVYGGTYPAKVFREVMSRALAGVPVSQFEKPEGVEELRPPVRLTPITDLAGEYNPQDNAVVLNWTPVDAPAGAVGYRIYRSAEPATWMGTLFDRMNESKSGQSDQAPQNGPDEQDGSGQPGGSEQQDEPPAQNGPQDGETGGVQENGRIWNGLFRSLKVEAAPPEGSPSEGAPGQAAPQEEPAPPQAAPGPGAPGQGTPEEMLPQEPVEPQGETLIGESSEGRYVDTEVNSRYRYTYYVVPYNTYTGEEGPASNKVTVEVVDQNVLQRYLDDLMNRSEDMDEFGDDIIEDGGGAESAEDGDAAGEGMDNNTQDGETEGFKGQRSGDEVSEDDEGTSGEGTGEDTGASGGRTKGSGSVSPQSSIDGEKPAQLFPFFRRSDENAG